MNPLFEPVMIAGDDQEQHDESSHKGIARAIPAGFEQGDRTEQAGDEDRQPPSAEARARARSLIDELLKLCVESLKLCRTGQKRHVSIDLTGSVGCRQ